MSRKIVGLSCSGSTKSGTYKLGAQYATSIAMAGGVSVMLAPTSDREAIETIIDSCDGILLTGGVDVSPLLYGEEKIEACGEPNEERDSFEVALLGVALEKKKPVLCICRGVQLLNVAMGGSLWQDVPSQRPNSICHRSPEDPPAEHNVLLSVSEIREKIGFDADVFAVNSYHHQAIKDIGEGLVVFARAEGDGIAEGVYAPDKNFVVGVQWHPEMWADKDHNAKAIFEAFVKAL